MRCPPPSDRETRVGVGPGAAGSREPRAKARDRLADARARANGARSLTTAAKPPSERHRKAWLTRRRAGAQAGNVNAARSFAYSVLAIEGEVAELVDYLLDAAPYLDVVADGPALAAAARLGVRARHAHAAVAAAIEGRQPIADSLPKLAAYLDQAYLRALAACSLTPQTRASLRLSTMDARARAAQETERQLAKYREPAADR